MKSYIVGISMFMILIFFILQWVSNEQSHYKRSAVSNTVHQYAQQARQEGYFSPQIIASMKADIAEKLKIDPAAIDSEIIIDSSTTTNTLKYRMNTFTENELIHYKIGIPVRNVVAMAKFLGIEESSNMYWFYVEGDVASEKLVSP